MSNLKSITAIILCLFVFGSCADTDTEMGQADSLQALQENNMMNNQQDQMQGQMQGQNTVVAVAQDNEDLSTLVSALESAGLASMLNTMNSGPYTVFAPTNDAFEALPEGTLDELMMEENQQQLASVLQYHVVEGAVTASSLQDGQMLTSVEGTDLEITVSQDGTIMVNGVEVQESVQASNGVVHIIGEVLMPAQ